jgi:hypothetical protein
VFFPWHKHAAPNPYQLVTPIIGADDRQDVPVSLYPVLLCLNLLLNCQHTLYDHFRWGLSVARHLKSVFVQTTFLEFFPATAGALFISPSHCFVYSRSPNGSTKMLNKQCFDERRTRLNLRPLHLCPVSVQTVVSELQVTLRSTHLTTFENRRVL